MVRSCFVYEPVLEPKLECAFLHLCDFAQETFPVTHDLGLPVTLPMRDPKSLRPSLRATQVSMGFFPIASALLWALETYLQRLISE
jgi:hypothetical protein